MIQTPGSEGPSRPLKYQRYSSRPTLLLNDAFNKHVHSTAQPETFPGLHPGPISSKEPFVKLFEFEIAAQRRPDGQRVPCPMCQPNKFLKGWLIWLSNLQAIAVIGHCCADQVNLEEADRRYKEEKELRSDEDFLLKTLPFVTGILETVKALEPIANEALHAYQIFRRDGATFHKALRKASKSGRLTLSESVADDLLQVGPAGIGRGGRGRAIDFGIIHGTTALLANYHPVADLARVYRLCEHHNVGSDEAAVLDYIVTLDKRARRDAVDRLAKVPGEYKRFQNRIRDFLSFFTVENIGAINAWASHSANPQRFYIEFTRRPDGCCLVMRDERGTSRVTVNSTLWNHDVELPGSTSP